MKSKVLAPLDGSPQSEAVLPFLRLLASKAEIEIELFRCFEPVALLYAMPELALVAETFPTDDKLRDNCMDYLAEKQDSLAGIETSVEVACASPAGAILNRTENNDLVVMASHGRGGLEGWLLGSVTTKVVRASKIPVLVVAGPDTANPKLNTIVAALDGSPLSERALRKAVELAEVFAATLILYRAVPMVYSVMSPEIEMEQAQADLDRLALTITGVTLRTVVHRTDGVIDIAERAGELKADLLVLGGHERGALSRWLMGSVAESVLHEAKCSVMVIY